MFSSSRRTRFLGVAGLLVVVVVVVVLVSSRSSSSSTSYYLALGDSLSVGIQPTDSGDLVITPEGYVDDLYAHYSSEIPHLKLVHFGCPGDDTSNVITGQGNAAAAKIYHCDRQGGSQLKAALAFIAAHRSQVKLISIDIGANDVNDCLNTTVFSKGLGYTISCINKGEQSVAANTPKILGPLKAAAAPGTALVGSNIYDPFLVGLLTTNATVDAIANQSLTVITRINSEIAYADAEAGFKTADVAGAYFTYDTTKVKSPFGASTPRNLVVLCSYTWACTKPPQGPNVHPNTAGYSVIAHAYESVLGTL
jgi:lysophospholipase L1-like esterase